MNKIKIDNYYKPESKTLRLDEVDYTIIPNSDIKPLLDKLQQENKQLRQDYSQIVSNNCDYLLLQQENQQLKDNWNKLKELIINSLDFYKGTDCEYIKTQREFGIREAYRIILGKMQEIEQGSDNK